MFIEQAEDAILNANRGVTKSKREYSGDAVAGDSYVLAAGVLDIGRRLFTINMIATSGSEH